MSLLPIRSPARRILGSALALLALAATTGASPYRDVTVIAPFVEGQSWCEEARRDPSIHGDDAADALCAKLGKNGAPGIAATLDKLGPRTSPSGRYQLGYTFIIPLLGLYRKTADGWRIDDRALRTAVSTIGDIDRPVVLHLSATHFSFEGQKLAAELGADPRNLMWTRDGPLGSKAYFDTPIYGWTLADLDAPINRYRREAFTAVLDAVCRLPPATRDRIAAVSFLGETHQLFPDLQGAGAGYNSPFLITDYAPASVAGFRAWLQGRFRTVGALNRAVGGVFPSFEGVEPPRRDEKDSPQPDRLRHIDEQASGSLAILGWIDPGAGPTPRVEAYVDGKLRVSAPADLSRLDVAEARPKLSTPNVGYHLDLDFRTLAPGTHTLTVLARSAGEAPYLVGERRLLVMGPGAGQAAPPPGGAPTSRPPPSGVTAVLDRPGGEMRLLYNPLAELWRDYREYQVLRFQESFARVARQSCIPPDRLFSHQIEPKLYPDYNPEKIAVEASLKANPLYQPGVTAYGGATFGEAFFREKKAYGWRRYGIGEFHPLFKLTPGQYQAMFARHHDAGAAYIAPYYLSNKIQLGHSALLKRLIAPDNPQQGSSDFYAAIGALMRND